MQEWADDNALGGGSARGRGSFKTALDFFCDGKLVCNNVLHDDPVQLADAVRGYVQALDEEIVAAAHPDVIAAMFPADIAEDGAAPAKRGRKPAAAAAEA